jgi:thymidylate kinase
VGPGGVDLKPGADGGERRLSPKGRFVLIVGPDGSGKTTLARRMIEAAEDHFTESLHIHWRPRVLPRAGGVVGIELGDPSEPHAREPRRALPSAVMLAYHWLDFVLGSWVRILPARRRGGLIVMERGWLDIAVDPRRYRLTVSPRVVELLGRLLPAPDFALILRADPALLIGRKAELPADELARQNRRWEQVVFPRQTTRIVIDAAQSGSAMLEQAVSAIV